MKKIVIAILIIASIPLTVLAEDISVEDLLGTEDSEITQNLQELEQERTEDIENELNISIPKYTDNPSHIITFRDPSEDEEGVELDIDESGYKDVNSPYSLPSLSIGEHKLKFRFVDSIGATKVLEYDLIVIPRPPTMKAPVIEGNNLILSGTGLAKSEVIITASVAASNYTQVADIDLDGNWNTSIELDDSTKGIYTIFGYTRKDGYSSNPSQPAVMEYGSDGASPVESETTNTNFNFSDIELNDLPAIISQNPDLLILFVSALLLGGLVSSLLFILFRRSGEKEIEKDVKKKINGNGQPKKEKTLMELFGGDDNEEDSKKEKNKKEKVEKESKKEEVEKEAKKAEEEKKKREENAKEEEEERKRKEKIFTRRDFLKDFKKFDPDKDSGKENKEPSKEDKKDVIVTLTSKVEE